VARGEWSWFRALVVAPDAFVAIDRGCDGAEVVALPDVLDEPFADVL